jgi:dTDP-glucose pyrophosphorylase
MKIKENAETKGSIFIADCDQFVESKKFTIVAAKLNNNLIDVAIPIFNSNREIYSYARVSKDDEVTEVAEKEVISSHAIAGVYGFQSFELFEDLYQSTKYENSEEYISPVIQNAINQSLKVRAFQLEEHIPFGTPDEYRVAIRKL